MRLFLDTSVLLAACGSSTGASREIFRLAPAHGWVLVTTPYAVGEVLNNLVNLPPVAGSQWEELHPHLLLVDDVLTLDRVVVFPAGKDRPILFSALAWTDVLLTLDRNDFGSLLGFLDSFSGFPTGNQCFEDSGWVRLPWDRSVIEGALDSR